MTDQMSLQVFDPMKAAIGEIVERDSNLVFDHSTPDGETELRSYVYRIKRHKGDLEKVRKEAKSGALAFGRKVDEIAKELNQPLLTIIADRMKPLDEIEEKKRAAAEAAVEAERVEEERIEAERLADLKKREEAVAAKEAEQKAKEDDAKKVQEEADRIIREKKIAEDAAENAKKQAEIDKAAAIAKVKQDAQDEADRVERNREAAIAAAAKADAAIAATEEKRVANKKHRLAVETAAINAMWAVVNKSMDNEESNGEITQRIIDAIMDGKIPNVSLNY